MHTLYTAYLKELSIFQHVYVRNKMYMYLYMQMYM